MNLTDKINNLLNIVDSIEIEHHDDSKVYVKAWLGSGSWEQSAEFDELESAITRLHEVVVFEISQHFRKTK